MGRPELGTKCTCTGCLERFYDLNRSPAVCPKCGAQQPPEKPRALRPTFGSGVHSRRQAAAVVIDNDVEPAGASVAEADEEVPEVDDDAEDDIEIDPDLVKPAD